MVNTNDLKAAEQAAASREKWRLLSPVSCTMFSMENNDDDDDDDDS